jgi:hypothetical protein
MAKAVVYQVVPARAASEFKALPTVARTILKLCDGTRTMDAICDRSPVEAERTERIVLRLVTLGVIATHERSGPRRRSITPNAAAWIEGAAPAESPAPVVEPPAPVVEPPAPVVEPPAPVVEPPAPVAELVAPVVESPAPIAAPAPVVETPVATQSAPIVVVEAPLSLPGLPLPEPTAPELAAQVLDGFSAEEELFFASSIEHLAQDEWAD